VIAYLWLSCLDRSSSIDVVRFFRFKIVAAPL